MKKRLNRMLSTLLICSMVMTLMPTTVFATNRKDAVMEEYAGGLCEHHPEHDDECGYSEGIAGTDCSHEHTDDCYTEVVKCTHRHDEDCYPDEIIWDDEATPSDADRWEPEDCPHMCEEDSECITKKLNCRHEHDDECGYSPATRGTPCEFECEICGVDDDMKTATPSNAKAVTVAGVQAMIDALPDVEKVRKGNAEKVKAQLDAIDDAKAELSDEEIDELDLSHYMEVAAALEQLLYGVATQSNAVMLADYDGPAIQLGTGGISGPTEEEEDGKGSYYVPNSYIYFGVNSGNSSTPIKWRVLDADMANDGTTSGMFLLSEYLLASDVQFNSNVSKGNAYQGSDAQTWCSSFAGNISNFSTAEQAVMFGVAKIDSAESSLYDYPWRESSLTANDKLFFLSVRELADYVGNYTAAPGLVATDTAQRRGVWWLRSPSTRYNDGAGTVPAVGQVRSNLVTSDWAARPAFNLDLNAVLFTSAAEGGKSDVVVDSNLTEVGTGSTEWKLTLRDTSRNFNASASNTLVRAGENLAVTYSGAGTGENEYVSAMLADNSDNILYYGRIAQNSADGTASVAIPSDLTTGTYTLKVFSEQYNGDYKTDYASEFQDITLTVKGKVSEQFNLTPGTTYLFDLSAMDIPGTVNDDLPDKTMHYVPFTYVGTVDAYVLNSSSSGENGAADDASGTIDSSAQYGYTYDHSLFIADNVVTHAVSWEALNSKNIIFGTAFQNNGVEYTLRAPSAGSSDAYYTGGDGGTPQSNEWDKILDKDNEYIDYSFAGWGQDTSTNSEILRAGRGNGSLRNWDVYNVSLPFEFIGFRPVLEVLNPDTLGADGLKTVVLDLNGGSIGDDTDTVNIVVKNGESFTAPESSSMSSPIGKTDTDFCWMGSDGNFYVPGADVPAGVTSLTAQWTALTYTVTLNINGGTIASGKDVTSYTYGDGATLPTSNDITREGYTFDGWYADSSFSGAPVTEISSTDIGNKEFYAKWGANIYAVTLNTNGGTIASGKDVTSYTYGEGATLPTANDMTREGHTFEGWYADSSFSGAPVTEISSTDIGNKEFYAKWRANIFAVTLNPNGGTIASGKDITSYTYGEGATLPTENDITREGYTFEGWYADSSFSGAPVTAISSTDIGNKEFYAKWGVNIYAVTLNTNGGAIASGKDITSYTYGDSATLPTTNDMTRDGYTFAGWYADSSFSGTPVTEISSADMGNKEFYAKWDANLYAVTLNPNGGTIASGKDVTSYIYGDGAALPTANDMTREGYTFAGWYADSSFSGTPVTEISSTDMGNKEFYAKWGANLYAVMLNPNGGAIASGKDVTSYTYGDGAALPTANDMTREGYTFVGWYADSSFSSAPVTEISSTDMGNKEFYAKWMRNTTPITPGDTVNYIVEHYKAGNNGYMLEETEYLGDKIGSNVTAKQKIYTGYTYNPDAVGSVTKGTLKKISSATDIVTLKLYYDLTVYNVIVENDGNGSASAASVSATMGEKITLTSTPNSGYRFKKWQIVSGNVTISGDAFIMPAGNVTVKALFERKPSGGGDSSSDRDASSSAIRKDPIKGRISSDRGILTGAANSTANDGYSHWMQDENGWWLRFADNSYPKGQKRGTSDSAYAWEYINGNWWAFDEHGYIKTGWLRDDTFGGWFYMDPERGMQTGWVLIDGVWYYFHPVSDGRRGIMYAGQKTPDGYYVDENGPWDGKEK